MNQWFSDSLESQFSLFVALTVYKVTTKTNGNIGLDSCEPQYFHHQLIHFIVLCMFPFKDTLLNIFGSLTLNSQPIAL